MKVYIVTGFPGYGNILHGIYLSRESAEIRKHELGKNYCDALIHQRPGTLEFHAEQKEKYPYHTDSTPAWALLSDDDLLEDCTKYYSIDEVDADSPLDFVVYME